MAVFTNTAILTLNNASITADKLSPELLARIESLEVDRAVLLVLVQELANRVGVKIDTEKECKDIRKRVAIAKRLQGMSK